MPSILLAVATFVLLLSLTLWGLALRRWRAGKPLLPAVSHSPVPWGLVDLALAAGIYLLVAAIGQSAVQPGPGADLDPTTQRRLLVVGSVAMLAVCGLVASALWIRHRVTARELGWDTRKLTGDFVLGAGAFVMLAPIVYGLQLLLTQFVDSKHPLIELLKQNPDPGLFAVAAFAAVLVAPLAEEFLFRVMLQGWLERMFARNRETTDRLVFGGRMTKKQQPEAPAAQECVSEIPGVGSVGGQENPYASPASTSNASQTAESPTRAGQDPMEFQPRPTAIILSSLFFALSHWSHGPDPIPLFVFALGLGYVFQRTRRIAPCIVLHFLLNLCSLGALWLVVAN